MFAENYQELMKINSHAATSEALASSPTKLPQHKIAKISRVINMQPVTCVRKLMHNELSKSHLTVRGLVVLNHLLQLSPCRSLPLVGALRLHQVHDCVGGRGNHRPPAISRTVVIVQRNRPL